MSVRKYFIDDSSKKTQIDEFLAEELKKAGYSRVELTKTPLGTRVVIYAAKPGIVIGRRGQSIRDLTRIFEEKFGMENPQISVAAIEIPELDPRVVASQIAMALQRGVHFRRAAYWAVQKVISAGALGVEITIRGKLSTERARYERYRSGYLPRVGDPVQKQLKQAVVFTQLKPGLFGVNVKILPPDAEFPDQPSIREGRVAEAEAEVSEKKEEVEVADTKEA